MAFYKKIAIPSMRPGHAVCRTTSEKILCDPKSLQSKQGRNGRVKQTSGTCGLADQQHGRVQNAAESVSLVSCMPPLRHQQSSAIPLKDQCTHVDHES